MTDNETMNINGLLVLQAVMEMKVPVSLSNIVDYIAFTTGELPDEELRSIIKKTVLGGVRYGYLQKKDGKYFVTPLEYIYVDDSEEEEVEETPENSSSSRRGRRRSVRRSSDNRSRSRSWA